jgi:hypothetical protein
VLDGRYFIYPRMRNPEREKRRSIERSIRLSLDGLDVGTGSDGSLLVLSVDLLDGVGSSVGVRVSVGLSSVLLLLEVLVDVLTEITRVDVGVLSLVTGELLSDELLVNLEDVGELLVGNVVQESTLSELAVGDSKPLLSVSGLCDEEA